MTDDERSSEDSKDAPNHPFRDAFDRTTRWFGNLLAPLVIVTYAKEAQQAIDYILDHLLLASVFSAIFVGIFAYNIFGTLKLQFGGRFAWRRADNEGVETKAELPKQQAVQTIDPAKGKYDRSALLRWTAIVASSIALLIMAYAYVAVFVTGLHYVAIASAPNKESAIREVQSLNDYFDNHGYPDLKARTHASTGSGSPWYMISIGGWHTSEEAAKKNFQRAKKALGAKMRSDAYIYSTENISPIRMLGRYTREFVYGVKGFFKSVF
jgi:hypothetical protein